MNSYDIQREELTKDLYDEIEPMFEDYHEEVQTNGQRLNPSFNIYSITADNGYLGLYTIRFGEEVVGFLTVVCGEDQHCEHHMIANHDLMFVKKDHRSYKLFKRLLSFVETDLKGLGVNGLHMGCTLKKDLSPLYERSGYELTEYKYYKEL